jgi:hypothetical protein
MQRRLSSRRCRVGSPTANVLRRTTYTRNADHDCTSVGGQVNGEQMVDALVAQAEEVVRVAYQLMP